MAGRSSSHAWHTLQKKKKTIFPFCRTRQISRVRNAYVTTINRRSIRADSPLITNKYLTSSLPASIHQSRPDFAFNERVRFVVGCVRFKVERERFLSLSLRICSSNVVWHRRLFLVGKDFSCIEWSNFFWNHGCACTGGEGSFPTSCQLPKIWGNSNCRGFPTSSWQYRKRVS